VGYLLFPLRHESPLWRAFLFSPGFRENTTAAHKKTRFGGFCLSARWRRGSRAGHIAHIG
jgi:hypothetical protein